MISDERRREIMDNLSSLDAATEYLDRVENTIVHVHRREDTGPARAQSLKLLKDILAGFVECLNDKVMDFSDDLDKFSELKKRAKDYYRQVEEPPEDLHTHNVVVPGAELLLEEEERHDYKIIDRSNRDGMMIALSLDEKEDKK